MKKFIIFIITLCVIFPFSLLNACSEKGKESVNMVVTVEFSDTQTFFEQKDEDILNSIFGKNSGALHDFIYKNSSGKVSVNSLTPEKITVEQSIDYFMPRYELTLNGEYQETNPKGYDNRYYDENGVVGLTGKQSAERFYREQELVYIVSALVKTRLGKNENLNSLIIIPSKLDRYLYGQELFWPHTTTYYSGGDISSSYYTADVDFTCKEAKIGDESVKKYILMPYSFIYKDSTVSTVTICHEYMHVLGAPDFYSYDGNPTEFVGEFDLMGESTAKNPSLSLSYLRYRMGWLEEGTDVLAVTKSGEYTLFPTESGNGVSAYKIVLPEYYQKGESFYIEYRKDDGNYDLHDGVIIYRVNENNGYISPNGEYSDYWFGNSYGNPEVFVFRFWRELFGFYEERTEVSKNGICYATLTDKFGYTEFGNTEDKVNAISYSDGSNSGVTVTYLRENSDGSVTVSVTLPETEYITEDRETIAVSYGNRMSLFFGKRDENTDAYVLYSEKQINNPTAEKILSGKYGQVKSYSTAFLEVDLPKFTGYERFVYLFYGNGGEYSTVKTYRLNGIKNIKIGTVIIISVGVGILVPTIAGGVLKTIKSRRRKQEDGQQNE